MYACAALSKVINALSFLLLQLVLNGGSILLRLSGVKALDDDIVEDMPWPDSHSGNRYSWVMAWSTIFPIHQLLYRERSGLVRRAVGVMSNR